MRHPSVTLKSKVSHSGPAKAAEPWKQLTSSSLPYPPPEVYSPPGRNGRSFLSPTNPALVCCYRFEERAAWHIIQGYKSQESLHWCCKWYWCGTAAGNTVVGERVPQAGLILLFFFFSLLCLLISSIASILGMITLCIPGPVGTKYFLLICQVPSLLHELKKKCVSGLYWKGQRDNVNIFWNHSRVSGIVPLLTMRICLLSYIEL